MYLSSGRGRKSGGARATGATPSLAPLYIRVVPDTQCWKGSSEEKKVQPILLLDYDFWM